MLKEAMTHRLIITTTPEKRRVDLLMNEVDFDEFDLTNYGINKKYMSLNNNKYDTDIFPVMTLDKATQFPIREVKETQTDLPNDKETQTDDIDYTGLISDGFSLVLKVILRIGQRQKHKHPYSNLFKMMMMLMNQMMTTMMIMETKRKV